MQTKQTVPNAKQLSTSSQVKSQLLQKLSKNSLVLRDRVRTQEKVEPGRRPRGDNLELELSAKNVNTLQAMLDVKRADNEALRVELREIERQIKAVEAQIKTKQRDASQTKAPRLPKLTNADVENETTETRQQIAELNKRIAAKAKNLKEYESRLEAAKQQFAKLPADTKKQLVQTLNKDPRFRRHLREDAFLRGFFGTSDSSLEF